MNNQNHNSKIEFVVHLNGEAQGPFDKSFIEAMVMAGVYPEDVMVQRVGENKVNPLAQALEHRNEISSEGCSTVHTLPVMNLPGIFAVEEDEPHKSRQRPYPSPTTPVSLEVKLRWIIGIVGFIVVLWMMNEVTASKSKATNSERSNSPNTLASSRSSYASRTPAPASATPTSTPSTPINERTRSKPVVENGQIYFDSSGRTYRVSNSAYYRLIAMKSTVDAKQTVLNSAEAELESLASELGRERNYLDRSSEFAVDAFNLKVNRVNSMNDRLQALVNEFNHEVRTFNAELERVGTPIR